MRITSNNQSIQKRLASFPKKNIPLKQPASIYWDSHGIPFIEAQSDTDCAFILGMVHSHLRMSQMNLQLRISQGRISEIGGIFTAGIAHTIAIMSLDAAVDSIERMLPQETRTWIENYVLGINFYQKQVKKLPQDMRMLNIKPEPWTVRDVLSLARLISADVNWLNWFSLMKMRSKPYWKQLWNRMVKQGIESTPSIAPTQRILSLLYSSSKTGSNATVIGPQKTKDHAPILFTDPHLGLQTPNTWLFAGYKCPSYHVTGLMIPGLPVTLVGRNSEIAWAGTNMRSASSDLFFLSERQVKQSKTTQKKLRIRWWKDKTIKIRYSELGPILSDAPLLSEGNKHPFAFAWVGHNPSDELTSFLLVNKARNFEEFRKAFFNYGVSGQNFLYADSKGHIGYVPAVRIPKRDTNPPSDFLLQGDDPAQQWHGSVGVEHLPYCYDPKTGFIASANNMPFDHTPSLGYFFSTNDRISRLNELLSANDSIDITDIYKIQQDVYSITAHRIQQLLLDFFMSPVDPIDFTNEESELLIQLQEWNCNYEISSKGAVAFELLLYYFITEFYTKKYDIDYTKLILSSEHGLVWVLEDLNADASPMLAASLHSSLSKASKDLLKFKNWGDMHRLRLSHLLGHIPFIGKNYRFSDYPTAGSYLTLLKTAHRISNSQHSASYGANSRFLVRLKDIDENYGVLLGGQDGMIESDQFLDQTKEWFAGTYIHLPMSIESVKKVYTFHIQLTPENK